MIVKNPRDYKSGRYSQSAISSVHSLHSKESPAPTRRMPANKKLQTSASFAPSIESKEEEIPKTAAEQKAADRDKPFKLK